MLGGKWGTIEDDLFFEKCNSDAKSRYSGFVGARQKRVPIISDKHPYKKN